MALPLLKYIKSWFPNNYVEPKHWDEITSKTGAWATEMRNAVKQLGLDVGGGTYEFNGQGKSALTSNLDGRVTTLEAASLAGASNIGLDVSTDTTTATITSADGTALSATNLGQIVLNDTDNAGQMLKYSLSANLSVALTGGTFGYASDLTDHPMWIYLIDDNGSIKIGVGPQGGRESVASADCKTTIGDCTARTNLIVDTAISGQSNCYLLGWVKTNYDHTGGASEKLWTFQTSQGDVNIGTNTYNEVSGLVF